MEMNQTDHTHTDSVLPHADDPAKQSEHLAVLDLVPTSNATHIAIKSGSWFDPTIWQNGEVPKDGADVWIQPEVAVTYDAQSEARIHTIRLDGTLEFAADHTTKLLIDTFVVAPKGTLIIGDSDHPIESDQTARIIFTSDRAIDTAWDPKQLSRGLISHGNTSIYGADKLDFTSLTHDAIAGDRELVLNLPADTASPLGWKVGDQLVLGGTSYESWGDDAENNRFHDEVLTITKIDGNRIQFTNNDIHSGDNTQLRFDHTRPAGYEDSLSLYVANTTRNISFETESGAAAPLMNRGHVMFMHNPNVVVENAGFYNLGRTDKNQLIDDVGQNVDGSQGYGTNPRGRYSLHFHRTGVDKAPVIATGNAIVGSPGWGLVQHESSANLEDNVVFDVVGSGIVAESGNETGTWNHNLTIKTTGDDHRDNQDFFGPRSQRFDFGFNGEGYWVQGAGQIAVQDNVAISAGTGIGFLGFEWGTEAARPIQTVAVDSLPSSLKDIAKGTDDSTQVEVSAVPLRQVTGFESYNVGIGVNVWSRMFNGDGQLDIDFDSKGEPKPAHDFRTVIDNFKLWNVTDLGVLLSYSGTVDLKDGLILGAPRVNYATGIYTNDTSLNERYKNVHIEGFVNGLSVPYDANRDFVGSQIEQVSFANNSQNFAMTRGELLVSANDADFPAFFQIQEGTTFQPVSGNIAPVAQFSTAAVGGYAVEFDAGSSFDNDSPLRNKASHGIVSYGWDFDGDGKVDQFGRKISHDFGQAGTRNVTLTVWDNQGATRQTTQTLEVKPTSYQNPILNGDFSSQPSFLPLYRANSSTANQGWYAFPDLKWSSPLGALVLSDSQNYVTLVGQIWQDNRIRKGQQTFELDLKNVEGGSDPNNQIQVKLWGVNGQFYNNPYWGEGPDQAGALPMQRQQLASQTLGGSTFDWTHQNWNVNLADGYQYFMVEVRTLGANDAGDFVAIDNVQLLGNAPVPSDTQVLIGSANSIASITGITTASITEDTDVINGKLSSPISLMVNDADAGENKFSPVATSAPGNLGTLSLNSAGTFIYSVDNNAVQYLGAGKTKTETFTVQSLDGTASQDVSIIVNGINDEPAGVDKIVTTVVNTAYTFSVSDFNLSDPKDIPSNNLLAVKIATLPTNGSLANNGISVNAGDSISVADIAAGNLIFTPVANAKGIGYANFTFQVQDDGGIANGGIDLDQTPNTLTVNVAAKGSSIGDPHISTFDGLRYDFQGKGDFILVKALDSDLEVQVRQTTWSQNTATTLNTGLATVVDGKQLEFSIDQSMPLADGIPIALGLGESQALGNGSISRSTSYDYGTQGDLYTVTYANGDQLLVPIFAKFLINPTVYLNGSQTVIGLLGNNNGQIGDDLALQDGTVSAQATTPEYLLSEFATSWQVSPENSLFREQPLPSDSNLIMGSSGNDLLTGGASNDVLVGVMTNALNSGIGEIDRLTGYQGADTFVLGNRNSSFYVGAGVNDYALIQDFNSQEGDAIQLRGSANDYILGVASTGQGTGTGIFMSSDSNELIGIIGGVQPQALSLSQPSFQYV
jgi:VCBS repeat-containing protein